MKTWFVSHVKFMCLFHRYIKCFYTSMRKAWPGVEKEREGDEDIARREYSWTTPPLLFSCSFQLVCRQTAQCVCLSALWPNPPETKSISSHMPTRFVRLFITINCLPPTLKAFEGWQRAVKSSGANCHMSWGFKAVIQIARWPLGESCFPPVLQGS